MSIRTRAVKKGDKYILNGTKIFITNGPIADTLLIYAKTDPDRGAKGISAFIVEKDFPGFSVSRKLKKVGMRGSPTGELVFEDCEVPDENLVGELNNGVHVMTSGLDVERIVLAGGSVGMAQQALEYSVRYAVEREQFGQPIAKFQMIQQKLADMYARTEAARLMVYRAVFFAVGFETTAPANAMAVHQAHRRGLANFSILCAHVLVPPAMEAITSARPVTSSTGSSPPGTSAP